MVLASLSSYLTPAQRELIAEELPAELASAFVSVNDPPTPIESEESKSASHARELVASVCYVLAEELSVEALEALRSAVPPELAPLFADPDPEAQLTLPVATTNDTLATGKPGSRRPIAEARK